jgi:hypothetical protein
MPFLYLHFKNDASLLYDEMFGGSNNDADDQEKSETNLNINEYEKVDNDEPSRTEV